MLLMIPLLPTELLLPLTGSRAHRTTGMTTVAGKLNRLASVVAVGAAVITVAGRHAIAGGVCALFLVSHQEILSDL